MSTRQTRIIKGEEIACYTVEEFIKSTRPDGLGHIWFNDELIASFEEVLCDCCNTPLVQPKERPDELMVFAIPGAAWCRQCLEEWASQ
jgi:hypothetical protein